MLAPPVAVEMVTDADVVKVPAAGLKLGLAHWMVYTPEATALLRQPDS